MAAVGARNTTRSLRNIRACVWCLAVSCASLATTPLRADERAAARLEQLRIDADPKGAAIWIDGEPVGHAPVALRLPEGAHDARVQLAGYRTRLIPLRLRAAASRSALDIHVTLEPSLARGVTPEPSLARGATPKPSFARGVTLELSSARGVTPKPSLARGVTLDASTAELHASETSARWARDLGSASAPGLFVRDLGFAAMLAGASSFSGAVALEQMRAGAAREASLETGPARIAKLWSDMHVQQTWARVFVGAGGALTALGITLLIVSTQDEASPKARVALHCAPAKCRAELSGTF